VRATNNTTEAAMTQKVFLTNNYYGRQIKTMLTTFGPKKYSVAYFKNVTDTIAEQTADFTKRSAAMFSIKTHQG
jgi:hypothetical protein